jgi:hypothetical protein
MKIPIFREDDMKKPQETKSEHLQDFNAGIAHERERILKILNGLRFANQVAEEKLPLAEKPRSKAWTEALIAAVSAIKK